MSNMRQITYRDAVREAMCEEMRRDENVYLMGEDIGVYCGAFGVSKGMLEEFGPERVRETPISEAAFVGAGVGSAITGMRPIVELMFSDFMTVCYDQIINQAAKMHYMFAGKVNVSGKEWSAITEDRTPVAAGASVKVKSISGVKLVVEKE